MKMRKFLKKILRVKYLILLLAIVLVAVVAGLYIKKDLVANRVNLDNMEFSTEGFDNFYKKDEPKYDSTSKTWWIGEVDTKIKGQGSAVTVENNNWYIGGEDTGIKASMLTNKVVASNSKYTMFINEMTTIVTTVLNSSLKDGGDASNPADYAVKYSSANGEGSVASKGNFALTYSSTEINKPVNKEFNSFSQSVNVENVFEGGSDRHYSIKYLDDAVQIYYTIGNFGSTATYFPQSLYATVYKPARCLYSSEAEYAKIVAEYESDYMAQVGSLDNTFEERFRGNTQIQMVLRRDDAAGIAYISPSTEIIVYNQEARDYLIDVVLPALGNAGENVTINDFDLTTEDGREGYKAQLDAQAVKEYELSKSKAKYPSVSWKISVPESLVNVYGENFRKYFNNENSPLTSNPFMSLVDYDSLRKTYYNLSLADYNTIFYDVYNLKVSAGTSAKNLYNLLYSNEQKTDSTTKLGQKITYKYVLVTGGEEYEYASSGYVAKDSDGKFIYDENGNVAKQLYTSTQVEYDNAIFNVESEGLPIFKVALEFKLTDTGFVMSIPGNSLVDSTNVSKDDPEYGIIKGKYQIVSLKLTPYMTYVDNTQEGYIVVPDGSGAVINFNNGKTSTVSGTYYGKDNAYVDMVDKGTTADLLLGMYAFVNTTPENASGLIAAIEKGGGQFNLTAGVDSDSNFAYLSATVRSKESIRTGTATSKTSFDKFDKILAPSDLVVNYLLVEEDKLGYDDIAMAYKQYLIKRDGLTYNDTTNTLLTDLTFLGSFDEYALFMGIKYMKTGTLTTFDQAQEIVDELLKQSVSNISVSYRGWTNENLEYELGGALKISRKLGKTTSMSKFYEYCVEKGVTFYPELSITTAKGYDYAFGSLKYTARGVGNEEAVNYPYDLSTGRQNKKLNATYILSPLYYKNITENLLEDFAKLNIWTSKSNGGFLLTDLGNQWNGNYRVGLQVYGGDAVVYQQEALSMLSEGNKIKIEAPCDYAFKYVDVATNIPVGSNMYTVYDETIPFYQLVVNGLFDYTTENINGISSKSSAYYFAKALETGSNLSYMLSAEDPSILLETDYTQYYQVYYQNWKDTIINFNKQINDLGIHNCYLSGYEIVEAGSASLSKVTYTNKTNASQEIVLLVNVTNKTINYNGTVIPAYGYMKAN